MTPTPTKPSAAERAAKLRHTFYNVMGRGSRFDAAMWLEQELTALIEKADKWDEQQRLRSIDEPTRGHYED